MDIKTKYHYTYFLNPLSPSDSIGFSSRHFFISSTRYSPIAGDDVSPGDSIPAAFIKFSFGESIMKSPVLPTALNPVNDVITSP